ncbi:hypothetical protein KSP39_PZI002154 [Platanthera zijinensis]|uniref:Uncharacterized protein n=1 Tax=Platanthera zijinensis TaxID=2320716 RepID=A0AAP0C0A4_9ASPA
MREDVKKAVPAKKLIQCLRCSDLPWTLDLLWNDGRGLLYHKRYQFTLSPIPHASLTVFIANAPPPPSQQQVDVMDCFTLVALYMFDEMVSF